jgi:hypothetical protein
VSRDSRQDEDTTPPPKPAPEPTPLPRLDVTRLHQALTDRALLESVAGSVHDLTALFDSLSEAVRALQKFQRSAELDGSLKNFLDASAHDRREGHTLANMNTELKQFGTIIRQHYKEHEALVERVKRFEGQSARVAKHGRDIKAIKAKLDFEGELDTGQYEVSLIQEEMARMRIETEARRRLEEVEHAWWKRSVVPWIATAVGVVALNVATYVFATMTNARGAPSPRDVPVAPALPLK